MADRIFPNRFQEDPLDSDLVFQGIDWDNFNQRLAEAKEPKENKGLKALIDAIGDEEIDRLQGEDHDDHDEASMDHKSGYMKEAKKGLPEGLKKWMEENGKGKKKSEDSEDEDHDDKDHEDHEDEEEKADKGPMTRKGPKSKSEKKAYHFNHASQLSAEAVEAAVAAGDEDLKEAILAARHDRRVRLAGKIERQVQAQQETNLKLAQRRAYRESLVQKVAAKMDDEKEAAMEKSCEKCGGVYAGKKCECADKSSMKEAKAFSSAARKAFAAKALAEGFPIEYINARLGETSAPTVDKLSDIKNVLASDLNTNVKVAAASSMIKVATLSDADYSRIVDYWKNELGYGDQEWIDALFTKKYDK
jgi:hypothetical protein